MMIPRILLILIGCTFGIRADAALEPDHLLPVDEAAEAQYRNLLHAKLEQTDFDYGRIVVRPTFEPERSVSLYTSRTHGRPDTHVLTCVVAQESLWETSEMGRSLRGASAVRTRRIDMAVSAALAHAVRDVLAMMLRDTRDLRSSEEPTKLVSEGPIIEFSLSEQNGRVLRGEISSIAPTTPKLRFLDKLTAELFACCDAPESDRPSIEKKIEATTSELLHLTH